MFTRRLLAPVVALVLLAACSSDSKPTASGEASSSAAPPRLLAPPAGLPDFYGVPDPLPPGEPGDVIKTEEIATHGLNGTLLRVMYHSQSLAGDDIPVTGLIAIPNSPAPEGGRPIVSWAHGTTGIADTCAPSADPNSLDRLAGGLLDAGYLVVATDYEGLGTPGRHPYLVGDSQARGTIDIVRAARNLPDLDASDGYVVWGHSQGGHAAMFALDIADEWAPELKLQGVVAGAPPSQLPLFYPVLKDSPGKFYLYLATAGFNAAYGDEGAPLDAVLTPEGMEALKSVDDGCANHVAEVVAPLTAAATGKGDPVGIPPWDKLLTENDPGAFTEPSDAPLLVIHGGADSTVPPAVSQLMFDQLCKIGQVEQRWIYPDRGHADVIAPSYGDMQTWIDHRFAGEPAPDATPPIGQPDVQTQTCPS